MKDPSRTDQERIEENSALKLSIKKLEHPESKRKQVEEDLRKSEERYRTILEDMDEGYFETDLDGNFTFVNDAECRDLGYSREELIGMNYRQYSDEATAKKAYELYSDIYKTGKPIKRISGQYISCDGTRHFNEVSASLLRDAKGKPIGFRGISQDVSDRKRAEEALQRAHDELERRVADRTEELIRVNAEFRKENFSPVPGQEVHMTVSIGLAQYKPQEEMKAFVHRVDQLMYQGKKDGKNRVCCEP